MKASSRRRCRPFAEGEIGGEDDRAFSYRADEMEEEIAAARRERQVAELVDDEQREAAVVADPLAKSAVAFGLGERGDDVGERAEVDAAAGFDRLDAEGEAQMGLAGSGWTDQMEASARSMNCSPASARTRFLSSEGWKAKSKPARVLIAESLAIWTAILTRRFSRWSVLR